MSDNASADDVVLEITLNAEDTLTECFDSNSLCQITLHEALSEGFCRNATFLCEKTLSPSALSRLPGTLVRLKLGSQTTSRYLQGAVKSYRYGGVASIESDGGQISKSYRYQLSIVPELDLKLRLQHR